MAHATMLRKIGVLTEAELRAIVQGLDGIARESWRENSAGNTNWKTFT